MSLLIDYRIKQKVLQNVVVACQHLLSASFAKEARKYLNDRISKEQQIIWKFGYFPSDERIGELTSLIPKEDLQFLNLYYPKYLAGGVMPHGHFSDHNLVMPFHSVNNDIVALLGRCVMTEQERQDSFLHKYKYSNGCQKDLYVYGLNKAKNAIIKKNYVICVEGQFDCISLHSKGVSNTVALGWANISRYQFFQLHRYTNNIIVMFDNDEAGQKAKKRVKDRFNNIANIKLLSPPKNFKDIDEFFRVCNDQSYKQSVIDMINNLENNG